MQLKISHITKYQYDEPVHYALQQVRLTPPSRNEQQVVSWRTTIEGGAKELEFVDQHNNNVMLVSVKDGQTELTIHSEGEVTTSDTHGIVGEHRGFAPLWFFKKHTPLTQPGPKLAKLVKTLGTAFDGDIQRLHALSGLISETVTYETGKTHSETTAEEALSHGHGVCQDHAHIFIAAARLMDYPARYVSGYLMMDDRVDQDATHAWAEAYLAGIGWVGFDVSNNISPDERYVRIATGLDYKEAAPISGLRFGDSDESMIVSLQVQQ
ncbi:transglutaminase family protein [Magnetovibrio sp.]|uniref:transglutaminase family protein n=1 Tax=Magnetovibrio sp. TaxID=2024836 RepID=UPI002F92FEEC